MAEEQKVVERDFLGIGRVDNSADAGDPKSNAPTSAFHDASAAHLAPKHVALPNFLSGHGNGGIGSAFSLPKGNVNHSNMAFTGMKFPLWPKDFTSQNFQPSGNFQGELCMERAAQNLPDGLMVPGLHPSHVQDLVNSSQRDAFCSQAWWRGSHSTPNAVKLQEDFYTGGFSGIIDKPIPTPAKNEQVMPFHALRNHASTKTTAGNNSSMSKAERQLPLTGTHLAWPMTGTLQPGTLTRVTSCDVQEKQSNPQLTIFYGGQVNVFDDICAEKAQAIMNFAGNSVYLSTSLHESVKAQGNLPLNLQTSQIAVEPANQSSLLTDKQMDFLNPSTPCAVLSACQPVVPRALPLARKASLARFLEKRKERVQSKAPYSLHKLEQSLMPGERLSGSNYPSTPCDESVNMSVPFPCGLEGMAEYSPTMGVKEETSLSVNGS